MPKLPRKRDLCQLVDGLQCRHCAGGDPAMPLTQVQVRHGALLLNVWGASLLGLEINTHLDRSILVDC